MRSFLQRFGSFVSGVLHGLHRLRLRQCTTFPTEPWDPSRRLPGPVDAQPGRSDERGFVLITQSTRPSPP